MSASASDVRIVPRADDTPRRVSGWLGATIVVFALVSALVTFLVLSGVTPVVPVHEVVVGVFVLNALLILLLLVVVAFETAVLIRARRAGAAAAGLHVRIVGLFSIIAALPAVLVAVIATVTIERGLEPWFSDRMRDAIFRSVEVADAYAGAQCKSLGREIRVLADDLSRAKPAYDVDRKWFETFLTARATALGVPVVAIMQPPDKVLARANLDVLRGAPKPDEAAFEDAQSAPEPICVVPSSGRIFGALVKLPAYDNAFLHIAREVDPLAVEFPAVARAAAAEYLSIDARRKGVQVAFASMYGLIAVILLLSAIWLGLSFANRLVAPIRRMIHATDQVSSGNFYVQVPIRRSEGDLAHLGETFNKMTAELRRQRDGLVTASEVIDRRRRFTETVLSGVSSGVLSLDGDGHITIINRSAESLLGTGGRLLGESIALVAPEIAAFATEALHGRQRQSSGQIAITRGGRDRMVNVRAVREGEGAGAGLVITLDDITDLVSAQRTAAWADVARRIAHEIKNPLTPIQLSAERIRRKFGRVIVEDKDVFDQCTATIVRQVEDIRRMVDEFSSFARMPKPSLTQDDIAETVRQIVFLMRVGNPELTITENLPQGSVLARFDRRLLSQALTNVIKNATEAIEAVPMDERGPGCIDVTFERREDGRIVIEVIDNGKGLPADQRQKLLEPYMTTREGGTGLGLAIVGKILEDHGGGIELLDRPDAAEGRRGARIRLWFPETGPSPEENPEGSRSDQGTVQGSDQARAAAAGREKQDGIRV
ncbi:PAS domain-containing sensor histidine kinase [Bosea sp. 124]|uniref:sensor histidine kinase NtrY-like n=1 Tax=Bosea sp. 124 TaxID=2135642 RepID=UPI000D475498|nr:PAS domain-containing sensor histidine kinase [Bosea sp. 124]PTM43013.1 two-component system nitrogen regulation sensor histidine kinase NtrY [Bosea sp. 124]